MRNLYCNVEALRKQVFAAVAKLAYEGGDYCSRMEKLPYEIIPGEVGTYRESIFLERAIVGERIRLAMGLPLRDVTEEKDNALLFIPIKTCRNWKSLCRENL